MIKNLGHRKLSKTGSHRRAMFSNMAASLLLHEKVKTTVPKAKELRRVVEGVVNDAKLGRRLEVRRIIKTKDVYRKVFDVLAPRYKDRNGGCTRILRLGVRKGDAAEVALIKLVD
ncbi:MAG: 50S ribosomal protein L17 [Elusimicrobia bacterium GWA2_56_46]|jgi:large subunit ribosomal protein L17|nr:MAG: 50S ribosomal protein L17 [Elusimicrobia bacterium GWA2_56_46]OGR54997.1 MAG: 50S ribosomal protein L17 [Elusimicrobia bacterium GWC2_56_31]HBW23993.1 50S ribosomal protein L17 [Elusimicrobiota bacterium]